MPMHHLLRLRRVNSAVLFFFCCALAVLPFASSGRAQATSEPVPERKLARHAAFCSALYSFVLESLEYGGETEDNKLYQLDAIMEKLNKHSRAVLGETGASRAYERAHAMLGEAINHNLARAPMLIERYGGFCANVVEKLP